MNKIEHLPLNDRAYQEIRKGLTTGRFAPKQPLVIRTLAESYGISATPIREALQRLVAERLLEVLPNRSIVVPEMTKDRFRALFPIRGALEGLAAELAVPNLTRDDLAGLREMLGRINDTATRFDSRAYMALNKEFHFWIYERSGNPELIRLIQDMWLKVGPIFTNLFDDAHFRQHANDEHVNIMAALEAGDAPAARVFMVKDLDIAAQAILPRLPDAVS